MNDILVAPSQIAKDVGLSEERVAQIARHDARVDAAQVARLQRDYKVFQTIKDLKNTAGIDKDAYITLVAQEAYNVVSENKEKLIKLNELRSQNTSDSLKEAEELLKDPKLIEARAYLVIGAGTALAGHSAGSEAEALFKDLAANEMDSSAKGMIGQIKDFTENPDFTCEQLHQIHLNYCIQEMRNVLDNQFEKVDVVDTASGGSKPETMEEAAQKFVGAAGVNNGTGRALARNGVNLTSLTKEGRAALQTYGKSHFPNSGHLTLKGWKPPVSSPVSGGGGIPAAVQAATSGKKGVDAAWSGTKAALDTSKSNAQALKSAVSGGSKATRFFAKAGSALAILGGVLEGWFTFQEKKEAGASDAEAATAGAGAGLGTVGGALVGMKIGAVAGSFVFPPIGTVVGGILGAGIGAFIGSKAGKWVGEQVSKHWGSIKGFTRTIFGFG